MPDKPSIYTQEHEDFRSTVRDLPGEGGRPPPRAVGEGRQVSREVWTKAGAQGLLCFDVDEEYGGAGVKDFRYNMVVARGDQPGRRQRARLPACTTT